MKILLFLITCFLCSCIEISTAADILCNYLEMDWSNIIAEKYACDVINDPNIRTTQDSMINSISGSHTNGRNNDDVNIFHADNKNIEYFPQGLEKFFKNIKAINIYNCNLKEIRQSDLKPFTKLTGLQVYFNNIEVLEEGLFDYNPDLVYIYLPYNKISQIYSNIFDHLSKLVTLHLHSNECTVSTYSDRNSTKIKQVIREMKMNCPRPPPRISNTTTTTTITTTPALVGSSPAPTSNPDICSACETQKTSLNNEIKTLKENFCIRDFNSTMGLFQNYIKDAIGQQVKDIENSAMKFQEKIKIFQNATTIDFIYKLELIEDRINNLVIENTKSFNDVNKELVDMQYKMDIRSKRLEKTLMDKSEENMASLQSKIGDLEDKLNIIIKALNKNN